MRNNSRTARFRAAILRLLRMFGAFSLIRYVGVDDDDDDLAIERERGKEMYQTGGTSRIQRAEFAFSMTRYTHACAHARKLRTIYNEKKGDD